MVPARRWRAWVVGAIIALLVLPWAYIAAFTPAPGRVALPALADSARRRVYVAGWGYHTSIIVEQPLGWRLGPPGEERAPYVEYAWGDRRFYMESNFWPHSVFATLFLPTESVVYVAARATPPARGVARELFVREVSAGELRRLVAVLEAQIARAPDGARSGAHPRTPEYPGRFYPGRELYIFWQNCNTWTVRVLRAAGLVRSHAAGVMLARQVGGRLDGFARLE